jgi:hypothetical protein
MMLQKRVTRIDRIRRHRGVRPLVDLFAGLHAANGLAHGIRPGPDSPARSG